LPRLRNGFGSCTPRLRNGFGRFSLPDAAAQTLIELGVTCVSFHGFGAGATTFHGFGTTVEDGFGTDACATGTAAQADVRTAATRVNLFFTAPPSIG
jgi:hypothetical protein